MGQNSYRSGKYKQATCQSRLKTQFAINYGGCTIDIHGYIFPRTALERHFYLGGNACMVALNNSLLPRFINELHKARGAWVNLMKSVAETRNDLSMFLGVSVQHRSNGVAQTLLGRFLQNAPVKAQTLFASATVHIVQHIDGRSHGTVERQPAGNRHPGNGDRWRLRAVVDGRD